MSKAIIAIIALIMMILCISSVTGQSVSYGYDQFGRITCLIYNYGNVRYLDYGYGIGHWEVWDGSYWQYYALGNSLYSGSYSNNQGYASYSGSKSLEQLKSDSDESRREMQKACRELNEYERENGWSQTTCDSG